MSHPPDDRPARSDDGDNRRIVSWIREHHTPGEPTVDVDAAWSRFAAVHGVGRRRFAIPATAWRVAAALVVAAGLTTWKLRTGDDEMLQRVAANGERASIVLADGSRVTLNGGSTLRYGSAKAGDRDLYLDGEAFFEVTHDPRRAFRVHAAGGVIRDIGTKFTVRAYAGEGSVRVAVTEGSVALGGERASGSMNLVAGEVGAIDSTGAATKITDTSVERFVGWTSGALVFERSTLADVARELEHRYGVPVTIDPSLAGRSVTARFHRESLDQVLDAVVLALGARHERRGAAYVISPAVK